MRVVFMGTPAFAVTALEAIKTAGHDVIAVYTQAPKPSGRGQKERLSAVHEAANAHGFAVFTPPHFKTIEAQAQFVAHGADVAVVAAYGLLLPQAILDAPLWGCLNIHASLLPRWRGAAPLHRAVEAGDALTGITIMQMGAGLDTGGMVRVKKVCIKAGETTATLHDTLAIVGANAIVEVLRELPFATITPQPTEGVTYAAKITKAEAQINWAEPAVVIERKIRAFSPQPAAWFVYKGETFKVMEADVEEGEGTAGTVLDARLLVACGGNRALRLTRLQRQGKSVLAADDFLRGFVIAQGESFAV